MRYHLLHTRVSNTRQFRRNLLSNGVKKGSWILCVSVNVHKPSNLNLFSFAVVVGWSVYFCSISPSSRLRAPSPLRRWRGGRCVLSYARRTTWKPAHSFILTHASTSGRLKKRVPRVQHTRIFSSLAYHAHLPANIRIYIVTRTVKNAAC